MASGDTIYQANGVPLILVSRQEDVNDNRAVEARFSGQGSNQGNYSTNVTADMRFTVGFAGVDHDVSALLDPSKTYDIIIKEH